MTNGNVCSNAISISSKTKGDIVMGGDPGMEKTNEYRIVEAIANRLGLEPSRDRCWPRLRTIYLQAKLSHKLCGLHMDRYKPC